MKLCKIKEEIVDFISVAQNILDKINCSMRLAEIWSKIKHPTKNCREGKGFKNMIQDTTLKVDLLVLSCKWQSNIYSFIFLIKMYKSEGNCLQIIITLIKRQQEWQQVWEEQGSGIILPIMTSERFTMKHKREKDKQVVDVSYLSCGYQQWGYVVIIIEILCLRKHQ